ncbi:Glutaredoxin [Amphibacillus marinus]|uniref:Glutaredoxin n=1 Tax=Amphibacillus marinus TaxID=872970 RepID=A0A1H8IW04_9BACI|nr:glutaredoxin family protein [Amphibacillus marinus]SEN72539.1 Glutaredoxin [Amphibacillus marinus]
MLDHETLYTTGNCPYCIMMKNFLIEEKVSFTEVRVDADPAAIQQAIQQTGRLGIPQLEVNGQWVVG